MLTKSVGANDKDHGSWSWNDFEMRITKNLESYKFKWFVHIAHVTH